jgi:hypothetical protein
MTRKITIMALVAGIVLGAAATEGFNLYRQSQDSQIFERREHCKAVADAYVKENSTDFNKDPTTQSGLSVTLDKVDYSPARNSCVAELESTIFFRGGALVSVSVQDLLSGKTLFSVPCNKGCVEEFQKMWFVDPAFDYLIKNADEPRELEKEWVAVQSKMPKGATGPPSGSSFIPDSPPMSPASKPTAPVNKPTPAVKEGPH